MARIRIEASTNPRSGRATDTLTGADLSSVIKAVDLHIGPENGYVPTITVELLDAEIVVDGIVVGVTVPEEARKRFSTEKGVELVASLERIFDVLGKAQAE